MPTECIEDIVPVLQVDLCKGKKINTTCVISEKAFALLNIPVNSQLDVILDAMTQALSSANTINAQQQVIIDNLLLRVLDLETP